MSDAELIARILASDDRHAFAELVRRHQSALRNLLRKLSGGDAALADDLAQETFLKAYRALPSYRGGPDAKFSSWLYRIGFNVFHSNARRVRAMLDEIVDTRIEGQGDAAVLRRELAVGLAMLRDEERTALSLAYGQDVSHEEAAAILNWPVGTLKTHIHRGKEKLRRHFATPPEAKP